MRCGVTQLNDPVVSEELKSLSKVFSKKLFDNLNTHDQIEHLIDLLSEKLSKRNLIYNISYNELATIKNYLNNVFKKN